MAFTDAEIAEAHQAVRDVGHSEDLYKLGLIYSTVKATRPISSRRICGSIWLPRAVQKPPRNAAVSSRIR
jgi:hypothetical protein